MNNLQNYDSLYNDIITFFENSFMTKMIIKEKEMKKLNTLSKKLRKLKLKNDMLETNNNKIKEKINSIVFEISDIKENIRKLIFDNAELNNKF